MIQFLKTFLPKRLFQLLRRGRAFLWWNEWQVPSWSQEGEDRILERLFGGRMSGFYVDVGAHHPHRYSNTFLFYRKGWRGINIDALPGSMALFNRFRSRDINLEIGVGSRESTLDYYMFNEPALNSFSRELSLERTAAKPEYRILEVRKVPVAPLKDILAKHCPSGQKIDFLSIDVEGFDLDVLKSNDWTKYRPEYVLVEALVSSFDDLIGSEVFNYLSDDGYTFCAMTANTAFFRDSKTVAGTKTPHAS